MSTINGTTESDYLYGSDQADTISGLAGSDYVQGYLGDDVLLGNEGDDTLEGGEGNDTVAGGDGSDVIAGDYGNNSLLGGNGDDALAGGYGSGVDVLRGGAGNDYLGGGYASSYGVGYATGADSLFGDSGNDTLNFSDATYSGGAYIDGGDDDDQINIGTAHNAAILGGNGNDRIEVEGEYWSSVEVNSTVYGGAGNDSISAGEVYSVNGWTLNGGLGDDILSVTNAGSGVQLSGGDGNDLFSVQYGGATIATGTGRDTIVLSNSYVQSWYYSPSPLVVTDFATGAGGDVLDVNNLLQSMSSAWGVDVGNPFISGYMQFADVDGDAVLQLRAGPEYGWQTIVVFKGHTSTEFTRDNFTNFVDPTGNQTPVVLVGTAGNDSLTGGDGNDTISGDEGDDTLSGSLMGNDSLRGGGGADRLYGNSGHDLLQGDAGNDWLEGGFGNDSLVGGDGADTLNGGYGDDQLLGGQGDDLVYFGEGVDVVDGGDGDDMLLGISTYNGYGASDSVFGGAGNDLIQIAYGIDGVWAEGGDGDDYLSGESNRLVLDGGDGADYIDGWGSAVSLIGGAGADNLRLGAYDDGFGSPSVVDGGDGDDNIELTMGSAWITTGNGRDNIAVQVRSYAVVTDFAAGAGGDVLDLDLLIQYLRQSGYTSSQHLVLDGWLRFVADGNDTIVQFIDGRGSYYETWRAWVRLVNVQPDQLAPENFSNGLDIEGDFTDKVLIGTDGADTLSGAGGSDSIVGNSGDDSLDGGYRGNDTLIGGAGRDSLFGFDSNDSLGGGDDADLIMGGDGNDWIEGGAGNDSGIYYWDGTRSYNGALFGGAGDDTISGGDGNDALDGGTGNDLLLGGAGDDTIQMGEGFDSVDGGEGNDTILMSAGNGARIDAGAGNDYVSLAQSWSSGGVVLDVAVDLGEGDDQLFGSGARFTVNGGAGDDIISVTGSDIVIDAGEGNDSIYGQAYWGAGITNGSITTGAGSDVIEVPLTPFGTQSTNLHITDFTAGEGGDTLDLNSALLSVGWYPGSGAVNPFETGDLRLSLSGSDTLLERRYLSWDGQVYYQTLVVLDGVSDPGSLTAANIRQGITPVYTGNVLPAGSAVTEVAVSEDELTELNLGMLTDPDGGSLTVTITDVTGGHLYLADGTPVWYQQILTAEQFAGLKYLADTPGGEGDAQPVIRYSVRDDESSTTTGEVRIAVTPVNDAPVVAGGEIRYVDNGSELVLSLSSFVSDEDHAFDHLSIQIDQSTLPSWLQWDIATGTLRGFAPDGMTDSFDIGISVTDPEGAVTTSVLKLRGGGIELWGTPWTYNNLVGGSSADTLHGANYNDVLNGRGGNDILYGGEGWDVLDGGDGADSLLGGGGTDTLFGGDGNDYLSGDGPDGYYYAYGDFLDGGAGADTMVGSTGRDTFVVDNAGDVVVSGNVDSPYSYYGSDRIEAWISYSLEGTGVDEIALQGNGNLNARGNSKANTLWGNDGNNILDGGAGADTMYGGSGNDTYLVDDSADVVSDWGYGDIDTVRASVSYALQYGIENLTLTGSDGLSGTGSSASNLIIGNTAGNLLIGNEGNDTLDGGAGADALYGGTGDDVLVVDSRLDQVYEDANAGNDTVRTSVTWTLGTNIENGEVVGTAAVRLTGNALANRLTGSAGDSILVGEGGNDTLQGGAGRDSLVGGSGNDSYVFGRGAQLDVVDDNDATAGNQDSIVFGADITRADLSVSRLDNNLRINVKGTGDNLVIKDWFVGSAHHVEQFVFANGEVYTDAQVDALISAMAGVAAPAAITSSAGGTQDNPLQLLAAGNG